MDARPTALRMALQGGGDRARRGSEASIEAHLQQQRRRGGSGDDSRRRDSMSTTPTSASSWECREPEQPRGSSPVSRSPSVRQRQGGLTRGDGGGGGGIGSSFDVQKTFESRESGAGGATASGSRAAAPGYREGVAAGGGGMTSYSKGGAGVGTRAIADVRTSMRAAAGGTASSSGTTESNSSGGATRRGSSSAAVVGNNIRNSGINNQAEDIMSSGYTPRRLSSSSARAASCPAGSPYLEPGFQQRAGGRIKYIERSNNDLSYGSRRSSGGSGIGGRSGRHRDSYHHHHHHYHEGGRGAVAGGGARTRASHPSTAPSASGATELDHRRLPSIDGLDVNSTGGSCPGGGGGGGGQAGCRGDEECFASSSSPTSSQSELMRREKDPPGNNGGGGSGGGGVGLKNSKAAAERILPGQGPLPENKTTSGRLTNNNHDDNIDDKGEGGRKGYDTCVGGSSASSADSRLLDRIGGYNSGGEVVTPSSRRIGSNSGSSGGGGGNRLRNDGEVAGQSSSSRSSNENSTSNNSNSATKTKTNSSAKECLVGLQNLGNTCFMNACLQCLLHTDALVDLFRGRRGQQEKRLGSHNSKSPTRGALAEAFRDLVALVEASPAHSNVSPAQVITITNQS